MRKFKYLLITLIFPLLISNQCTTAVKHAAIRTASAPYHVVKSIYSAVTPDQYKKIVKEEGSLQLSSTAGPSGKICKDSDLSKNTSVVGLDVAAIEIEKKLCKSCVPWASVLPPGPYCAPSCEGACEKVCPQKGFGILDEYKKKLHPSAENKFSFRNSSKMFKNADSALLPFQGYCSGMVSSRRKFNMNAFFDSAASPKDSRGNIIKKGSPKLIPYYKKIIERIHNNYPTEIPGYKNLGEFTSDPTIQDIMRQAIADEWADVTVMRSTANSTALYDTTLDRESMNNDQTTKLLNNIDEKVSHVGSATFYMGFGGAFNMHIVDATDVIRPSNKDTYVKATVCINDPNFSGIDKAGNGGHSRRYSNGELVSCSPSIKILKNGRMSYNGSVVKQARIDNPQDEATVTTAVKRLREYCKEKKSPPCEV